MSTKTRFGNKIIQLPGSYSRIISGQNNPPRDLDYGVLLIIDNDNLNASVSGNGMLGGAGVNGELSQGKNSIYTINDIKEFRDFVGASWWWKAAEGLFNPDGRGNGVSKIKIIKPATTLCANMEFYATGGGAAGGTFSIKTRDESAAANGVTDETKATGSVTVTGAGSTGNKITVKLGTLTVAEYTNASSDDIATMVAGLAANFTSRGICSVVSSTSPTIVFRAPVGYGSSANTITPTIVVTGTASGTATQLTGGVDSTKLYSGYAYTIETGVKDDTKWIFKIWRGEYKGLYSDNIPYDEIYQADSKYILMAQSPEFNNIQDLITWGLTNTYFGKYFVLDQDASVVTGLGTVTSADILNIKGFQPATGGSATYNSLADVLDAIKDLDYNSIFTTCSTADPSIDTDILLIVDHIVNEAKYDKSLFIAGDDDDIATTIGYAEEFDSERVNLVHGSIKKASRLDASGFRTWEAFFHAAYYVGRTLGLAPEVPLTFKSLNIDGISLELTDREQEQADDAGVLVTIWDEDFGKFINLHDVNTLQDNDFVLTNDGLSHLIQIERIKSQLNKELIVNSKKDLLSASNGVNRSSLTEEDAVEWTKTYLQRKLGSLIVACRNITAHTEQDMIFVDYEASPNTEIKGIFFTGRLYI